MMKNNLSSTIMPLVRYFVQIGDDVFYEDELVGRVRNHRELVELIDREITGPMKKRREELGDVPLSLLRVEVLNPYIHTHIWQHTYNDMSAMRSYYVCRHCDVYGYKPLNIVTGETANHVIIDSKFKSKVWATCRDKLREGPKQLNFR